METKQLITKWKLSQRRNQEGKFKIPSNELKWKYNITKSMKHKEGSQRERFAELRAYINYLKMVHINKLIMHLKYFKK